MNIMNRVQYRSFIIQDNKLVDRVDAFYDSFNNDLYNTQLIEMPYTDMDLINIYNELTEMSVEQIEERLVRLYDNLNYWESVQNALDHCLSGTITHESFTQAISPYCKWLSQMKCTFVTLMRKMLSITETLRGKELKAKHVKKIFFLLIRFQRLHHHKQVGLANSSFSLAQANTMLRLCRDDGLEVAWYNV